MSFAINLKREGQSLIEIGLYRPMNVFGEHQGILVNSGKIWGLLLDLAGFSVFLGEHPHLKIATLNNKREIKELIQKKSKNLREIMELNRILSNLIDWIEMEKWAILVLPLTHQSLWFTLPTDIWLPNHLTSLIKCTEGNDHLDPLKRFFHSWYPNLI